MPKGKPQDSSSRQWRPLILTSIRSDLLRTRPPATSTRLNVACHYGTQPACNRYLPRFKPAFMRHALRRSTPLPSSFVHLLFLSCSWQNPRREILKAKSPGPASTVNMEAAGDGGTTLTGADGLYNGRSVSRQNQPRIKDSAEIWRVCASTVDGLPLYWAIPSFLLKGIVWRDCAAFSNAGLFAIRNGARGQEGARVEN